MSPAEQTWMPEASRDRSSGTLAKNMPALSSEHLVWTIRYHNANEHWYYYRMTFHWQGQPVVNPAVRYPSDKENPRDEFGICQNDYDGLRRIFDRALSTNRPCAWNSIEPDASIAIYPGAAWPFCDRGFEKIYDSERPVEYWLSQEKERLTEAAKPNGLWTVMLFIDTENFRESDYVTGDGVILTISTERQEIERFRRELQIEYEEFSDRIGYREPIQNENEG